MNTFERVLLIVLCFGISNGEVCAEPKVTQASALLCGGGANGFTALAVEEMGESPSLVLARSNEKPKYSFKFDEFYKSDPNGFAYTNSFLRFKCYDSEGFGSPVLVAIAASPGGSDESFDVRLISVYDSGATLLNPEPIHLTIQDGIYLGRINKKYGIGMIVWTFQWREAHYDLHRYEIAIYKWDPKNAKFLAPVKFTTTKKYSDGEAALKHYRLPHRNIRDEVIRPEVEMSTLGAEELLRGPEPE